MGCMGRCSTVFPGSFPLAAQIHASVFKGKPHTASFNSCGVGWLRDLPRCIPEYSQGSLTPIADLGLYTALPAFGTGTIHRAWHLKHFGTEIC